MGDVKGHKGEGAAERAERLASALRENLRRRKAQARARAGSAPTGDEGRAPGAEPRHGKTAGEG